MTDTTPSTDPPSRDDPQDGGSPQDGGTLEDGTRRVLVELLKGPYIDEQRHQKQWAVLLRDYAVLRSRLADLFLELVVDHTRGVAFIRNAAWPERDVPKVVRTTPLTLVDTALLLYLRQELLRAESGRGSALVDHRDLEEQLAVYRRHTDQASWAKRVDAAVKKLTKSSVLLPTGQENRFAISPVLALVFDADKVAAVTRELDILVDDSEPETAEDENQEDE